MSRSRTDSPSPSSRRYDVVVAGARCAGASTAMLLARKGLRVLVADPLPRGRDTLSTHALMRGAVVQLHRWGLLDPLRALGTPAVAVTTFDYCDETVTVRIKPADGIDALYAPRRTVLDPLLSDAAERAGAEVVRGLAVVDLERDRDGRVRGAVLEGPDRRPRRVSAELVVGADGLRSRIARLTSAPVEHTARHATASIYGYWRGLDADELRWYFRPGAGIGTIPTNDDGTCVFVSVPPDVLSAERSKPGERARDAVSSLFERTVRRVDPALADRLVALPRSGSLRAFAGVPGFLRRSAGRGWALVGDAGYFKDPITAHGITDAFRDAELLARAAADGTDTALRRYQEERDTAARGLLDVTDRIASLTWSLDEVKALHRELSDQMKPGLELIRDFESPTRPGRRTA